MDSERFTDQRGFSLTEVVFSLVLWGILIVPFIAYYGAMQGAYYASQRQMDTLVASRVTMDLLSDEMRRAEAVGVAGISQFCFSYTSIDEEGVALAVTNVSYRWNAAGKQLLIGRGSGDLAAFCAAPTSEQTLAASSNQALLDGAAFSYYNTANVLICGTTLCSSTASPPNFNRVNVEVVYRPNVQAATYTIATSVRLRNL